MSGPESSATDQVGRRPGSLSAGCTRPDEPRSARATVVRTANDRSGPGRGGLRFDRWTLRPAGPQPAPSEQPADQVDRERDRGDERADRQACRPTPAGCRRPCWSPRRPPTATAPTARMRSPAWPRRPGVTNSASTSSAPIVFTDIATVNPSTIMKIGDSARTGTPRAAAISGSTVANINGRHMIAKATSTTTVIDGDPDQLRVVHRDDLAGQQAELVGRPARVERQEQHAEPQPERHQHADDRGPLAGPDPEQAEQQRRDQRAHHRPDHHVRTDQQRERCSGERQLADPVDREGQVAHHHEDTDQAADQPEQRTGDDRVVHAGRPRSRSRRSRTAAPRCSRRQIRRSPQHHRVRMPAVGGVVVRRRRGRPSSGADRRPDRSAATTITRPWAWNTSTGAPYSSDRPAEVSTSSGRPSRNRPPAR